MDLSEISKCDILKENNNYVVINPTSENSYITDIDIYTLGCDITTTNGNISFCLNLKDGIDEESLMDTYPLEALETKININI